jgi:hypothetical protein
LCLVFRRAGEPMAPVSLMEAFASPHLHSLTLGPLSPHPFAFSLIQPQKIQHDAHAQVFSATCVCFSIAGAHGYFSNTTLHQGLSRGPHQNAPRSSPQREAEEPSDAQTSSARLPVQPLESSFGRKKTRR